MSYLTTVLLISKRLLISSLLFSAILLLLVSTLLVSAKVYALQGHLEPTEILSSPYDDDFNAPTLNSKWHWIREVPDHWSLTNNSGNLQIVTQRKDIHQSINDAPILLQNFSETSVDIRTKIALSPTENYQQGGLVIYGNDNNYVRLTYAWINRPTFEFGREINGIFAPIQVPAPAGESFHLRMVMISNAVAAYYSQDGSIWKEIGIHGNIDFPLSGIGLSAFNSVSSKEIPANFDYFQKLDVLGISGKIYNEAVASGNEVYGAFVEACPTTGSCHTTVSSREGNYLFVDLAPGTYTLRALPPSGNNHLIGKLGPLSIAADSLLTNQNIILPKSVGIPAGTTIGPTVTIIDGSPSIYWQSPLILTHNGCANGAASYQLIADGTVVRSGNMAEISPGNYRATLEPLYPLHGNLLITISLTCPNGSAPDASFNVWIDPSGLVINTLGDPISNVMVSLYRSDTEAGPFDLIASGSGVMSPANRVNPMQTNNAGYFGWDVIAGYYKVRAEKTGCVAADNRAQSYVQTEALIIPPPVTDLRLVLFCGEQSRLFLPSIHR